ncbi:pyruvate kinase alpha/beta domain-containing protein, partial [Rhizobium ruizarguesonis]
YPGISEDQRAQPEATGAEAIARAARQIAETRKRSARVCYTASGTTGLRAARERPQGPSLALSTIIKTARRLASVWGLQCVVTHD